MDDAVSRVLEAFERETTPEKMSRDDYLDVIDRIIEDMQERREAAKHDPA